MYFMEKLNKHTNYNIISISLIWISRYFIINRKDEICYIESSKFKYCLYYIIQFNNKESYSVQENMLT